MEWLQLNHPWVYLAGFILVWIGRTGIPAAWRALKTIMALWKALEDLASLPPLIRRLEKEVLPNGGNSLGDVVRRIDRELAIMRERQRLVMDLTPLYGQFETDDEGRCVAANHTYCTWLQRSVDELAGKGWELSIHPGMRREVAEEWGDAVAGRRRFEMKIRYLSSDGRDWWGDCVAKPIWRGEELLGWFGVVVKTQ